MRERERETKGRRELQCAVIRDREVREHLDLLFHVHLRVLIAFYSAIQPPNRSPSVNFFHQVQVKEFGEKK